MSHCDEVITNIVAREMKFSDFLTTYNQKSIPEHIYHFFQLFLKEYQKELSFNSFKISPSNRIHFLETRNETLEAKVRQYREEFEKIKSYEEEAHKNIMKQLPQFTKSALKLQAYWRGLKVRSNLPKIVAAIQRNRIKRNLNPNEQVLFSIKNALNKLNLTLENAYRACDVGGDGIITTEEFSRFLQKLKLNLPQRTILRFIEILDNNYSGNIERDEFYDCLDAFSVSSENHFMKGEPYSIRVLKKFIDLSDSSNFNIFTHFKNSENKNEILTTDLLKIIKKQFDLAEQELQALASVFDPARSGYINYSDYIATVNNKSLSSSKVIKEATIQNPPPSLPNFEKSLSISSEKNPIIENFIQILKIYGLDPLSVFRFASKNSSDRISSQDFFVGLRKLVPDIFSQISEEELTLVIPNPLTIKIVNLMVENNSQSARSEENEYWFKRYEMLCEKHSVTLQVLFTGSDSDGDYKVGFEDLKQGLLKVFKNDLTQSECVMVLNAFKIEPDKSYSFKEFYNKMKNIT